MSDNKNEEGGIIVTIIHLRVKHVCCVLGEKSRCLYLTRTVQVTCSVGVSVQAIASRMDLAVKDALVDRRLFDLCVYPEFDHESTLCIRKVFV